jgi:hypothetical protein
MTYFIYLNHGASLTYLLLQQSMLVNDAESQANSTALFILPGLIEYLRTFRKYRYTKIKELLDDWLSHKAECVFAILRRANYEKSSTIKYRSLQLIFLTRTIDHHNYYIFRNFTPFHLNFCLSEGSFGGYSDTGVRQGDPLASIFYNIGIHSVVETINERITTLVTTQYPHNCLPRKLMTHICVDGTICAPSSLVNEATASRISTAEEFNLPIRPGKCFILSDVP